MPRETKKHKKEKVTRERLVKVSAKLFRENGYRSTTMQEIADHLDIKKGSIYYYIKTKEDLLYSIVNLSMNMLLEEVNKIYNKKINAKEKVILLIETHVKMIAENITLFSVSLYDSNKANASLYWNDVVQLRDQYEEIVQGILEQGMQEGLFKSYDRKLCVLALMGMMNWLVRWYNPEYKKNIEDIVQIWTDVFLHGITQEG